MMVFSLPRLKCTRNRNSRGALVLLALASGSIANGACKPAASGGAQQELASPAAKGQLSVGNLAPDLQALDHNGKSVSLRATDSPITLVYFYPKDNTPG